MPTRSEKTRPRARNRVLRLRTLRFVLKVFGSLPFDEAERDGFGITGARQDAAHQRVARDARIGRRRRRHDRERRRELVEAVVPPDFLDEIGLAQQVDAERRRDRSQPSAAGVTSRPRARRIRTTSASGTEHRADAQDDARRRCTCFGCSRRADRRRRSVRTIVPARSDSMSAIARCIAASAPLTSAPRSNRADASVFSPSRLLVLRTDAGLKYALSSTIVVVDAETSESGAAHHAGHRLRAIAVGDDQHLRRPAFARRRPRS